MHVQTRVMPEAAGRVKAALLWLLAAAALAVTAGSARGAELIPSVGMTRSVAGTADAKVSGGIALRGDLLPFLKDEIAISYRSEEQSGGLVRTRMWPVTASLWLQPVPMIYGGAGVGWYNTTYDYDQSVLGTAVKDETKQQFGVHLGGGVRMPLAPAVALDFGGRYVMLRDQESHLVPDHFSPNFWTATLGLGFHF